MTRHMVERLTEPPLMALYVIASLLEGDKRAYS